MEVFFYKIQKDNRNILDSWKGITVVIRVMAENAENVVAFRKARCDSDQLRQDRRLIYVDDANQKIGNQGPGVRSKTPPPECAQYRQPVDKWLDGHITKTIETVWREPKKQRRKRK